MQTDDTLITLVAFPDWLVGVSDVPKLGYRCWVITPDLVVLNDGEIYATVEAALTTGRTLVEQSLGLESEPGRSHPDL